MSKQLDSILSNVPPATASYQNRNIHLQTTENILSKKNQEPIHEKTERIVAVIPESLKNEIKMYAKKNGETERTILLKGLKSIGFNVKDDWLVDKRSLR